MATVAVPTAGSTVTDTQGRTGIAAFNPNTGALLTNPVSSSTPYKADISATGADISGLQAAYAQSNAVYQQEQARLATERTATIGDIKTQSEIDQQNQAKQQNQDYASRSTSLVTSGGGFLGATQSQQGVLQNLKGTFDAEHQALIAKRDAAVNAAQSAYNDKDFAAAKELANNAKDLQNQIYTRQTDFADQQLKIASENRAQTEFNMGITDKKVAGYANMSDAQFAAQNPADIAALDAQYYPGYTAAARTIAKQALDVKTRTDAVNLDANIMDIRLKTPLGQKITLGGQTYTGLKQDTASKPTQSELDSSLRQKVNTLFSPGYTIPNSGGIPFVDSNGKITPEGFDAAYKASGMSHLDFVKEFSTKIDTSNVGAYGLNATEKDYVLGKPTTTGLPQ